MVANLYPKAGVPFWLQKYKKMRGKTKIERIIW